LCDLKPAFNPNVLRSIERLDDAGVYQISKTVAIIQTIDFITPIVNDPYSFGRIAAANSISDIYTMGGRPITALNVVCFPSDSLDIGVLREILRGGLDTMNEAGVAMLGGHSVKDNETKYGLSVTGLVHPARLVTNSGTRSGDSLVLTKPLGTGVLSTALKNRLLADSAMQPAIQSMSALNKIAAELMLELGVHACTDITGFGLVGHASHLIQEGKIGLEFDFSSLPVLPGTFDFLKKKVYPGGLDRNRDYYSSQVEFKGQIPEYRRAVLFDPQTSGGLLVSLAPEAAEKLVKGLQEKGVSQAAIIGRVVPSRERKIVIR
jgi:selenide,water dikinase